MRNKFLFLIPLALIFLFTPKANASVLFTQTSDAANTNTGDWFLLANPVDGNATDIKVKIKYDSVPVEGNYYTVLNAIKINNNYTGPYDTKTAGMVYCPTAADAGNYVDHVFTIPEQTFSSGGNYQIVLLSYNDSTGAICGGNWQGATTGSDYNSMVHVKVANTSDYPTHLWHETGTGLGGPPPPSYSISIYYPADTQVLTGDFATWNVNLDTPVLTGDDRYFIAVQYELNGTAVSDGYFTQGGVGTFGVGKDFFLSNGNWTATAYLYNAPNSVLGDLLATSSPVSFTITTDINANLPPPPPEPICNTGQPIADAICSVLNYMFVPTQESTSRFQTLWTPIKDKIPFGYLTQTVAAFNDIDTGTSAYTLPTVTFLENFKAIVSAAIWIFFGVFIIKRIGKMQV